MNAGCGTHLAGYRTRPPRASGCRCEDWTGAAASEIEPLYRAECERWRGDLDWDFEPSCRVVETARRAGRLRGLVARGPGGRASGWTFFAPHEGVLQVGAIVGDGDAPRAALLEALVDSPDAAAARVISCFLYPQSPRLAGGLSAAGFEVEEHLYLASDPRPGGAARWTPPAGFTCDPDPGRDVASLAALLGRSYGRSREGTCFAADGLPHQWAHYVSGLLLSEGCGRYLPAASLGLRDAGGALVGATVVTHIARGTAHLAQVAVDAGLRGAGLGRALIEESRRVAGAAGYGRLTLLVAEGNRAARTLYARLGFHGERAFLHAVRP